MAKRSSTSRPLLGTGFGERASIGGSGIGRSVPSTLSADRQLASGGAVTVAESQRW